MTANATGPRASTGAPQGTQPPQPDYAQLDDPEFFSERRRVRERLESLPAGHADRAALARLYDAMTDEFTRRAARAWRAS